MVHVLYIDMGKNCLVVLLGLYADLVSSHIPTKKAIAYLLAFQNAWAMSSRTVRHTKDGSTYAAGH